MVIKSLKLKNYRNYDLLDLKFDPKTNMVIMLREKRIYWKLYIYRAQQSLTGERKTEMSFNSGMMSHI
jgi:hypothetical protein